MKRLPHMLLVATSLLSACSHDHVVYYDRLDPALPRVVVPKPPHVLRIFLDWHGDLYPEGAAAVPYNTVSMGGGQPISIADAVASAGKAGWCEPEGNDPTKRTLCDLRGKSIYAKDSSDCGFALTPSSGALSIWNSAQDKLWYLKTSEVGRALTRRDGTRRMLIVLIHGFNTDNAEPDYALAKAMVLESLPAASDPLFLQVHWDGLEGARTPWAKAQYNAPIVGLKLRRLFNSLPAKLPIRVITHSSGGIIAASIIGNATSALNCAEKAAVSKEPIGGPYALYVREAANRGSGPYTVPNHLTDMRIGMLVAATPQASFFPISPSSGVLMEHITLIFGMNPQDEIIRKFLGLENLDALGNTGMGTGGKNFGLYCGLAESLARERPGVSVKGITFSDSLLNEAKGSLGLNESHAFTAYLQRDQMMAFLDLLLNGSTTYTSTTPRWFPKCPA